MRYLFFEPSLKCQCSHWQKLSVSRISVISQLQLKTLQNMKKTILSTAAVIAVLGGSQLGATTFGDAIGDQGAGNTDGIMDITSVEVTHTATDIQFKINLNGNPTVTDWGKYCIGIDSVPGGDPVGDGWNRPIGMNSPSGMDWWVGSWVDGGNGAELRPWSGASWGLQSATYGANPDNLSIFKDASSVTIKFAYAGVGLSTFAFDVYTTGGGGGDGAIDALGNPGITIANWGDYYNSGSLVNTYTVPEPATYAFVGLGGLILLQRVFRRRS
jgi:hypothetical protein